MRSIKPPTTFGPLNIAIPPIKCHRQNPTCALSKRPKRKYDRFGIAFFRYGVSKDLKTELAPIFPLTDESGVGISGNLQFIRPASAAFPSAIYAGLGSYVRF